MSDYIEVLDETDPGSILDGDTLIHTDMTTKIMIFLMYDYIRLYT